MQKLRTTNKIIILISNIVELILINYFMNFRFQYNLSSNVEGFLRVNLVFILLDIIYFFILYDLTTLPKKHNPLKIYRKESNFVNVVTFLPYHIIKVVILFFLLPKSVFLYSYYYKFIILYELIPLFIFYGLYFLFPRRDNLYKKTRNFKRILKGNDSGLYNIILVHGDFSTFDLTHTSPYKIHKKNIYINDNDLAYLKKCRYDMDNLIKKCVTCEVTYLKNDDVVQIKNVLEKTNLEDFKKITIFVVKNKNNITDKEIGAYNAIKIVNSGEEIEYIENLLLEEVYEISTSHDKEAKRLYQRTFISCVPSDKRLFHMYKSAYYKDSPYQSILALFNYSSSVLRFVSSYYYCKNNNITIDSEINLDIVTDQFTNLYGYLVNDITDKDYLYDSLKISKYEFIGNDKVLFKKELKYLLDSEVVGEYLDFYELIEIFRLLRNKVEAHGSMTDKNIYMIWHVVAVLVDALNYFLKVDKLHLKIKNKYEIIVTYDNDELSKSTLGKYIINYDDMLSFLVTVHKLRKEEYTSDTYINFLTGDASIKINE